VQTIKLVHNDDLDLSFEKAYDVCVFSRDLSWFDDVKDKSYFFHGGIDEGIPNFFNSSGDAAFWTTGLVHLWSSPLLRLVVCVPHNTEAVALENWFSFDNNHSYSHSRLGVS